MSVPTEVELPGEYGTLHTGIALYDPDSGAILDANTRLESLFGYTTAELRGFSVERYSANTYPFSEADFVERLRASADGTPQQFRWRVKRADGELIWVQINLSKKSLDGRSYVCAEVRDITEYYNTSHREELFWRILRHNLRNETNTLIGYSERIRREAETEVVRDAAETIKSKTMELGTLTESVKQIQHAVERTETQRVRRRATVAVREVIHDIEADYPSAEIEVAERDRMWIRVDNAFNHALSHALENAIVHSEEPNPTVEVVIGPSPNTGRVEIRIKDTNPPIPDAEVDSLFNRNEVTDTSHGSGVGLFVMKWCIESLGGELRFERRASRGNTVYFYFPPQDPPAEAT